MVNKHDSDPPEISESEYGMPKLWNIDIDAWCIPLSLFLGLLAGVSIPGNNDLSSSYRIFSSILGWTYFFSWTLSFYPQLILNWARKNTLGMKSDKLVYDIIGFSCLSIYTLAFYGVPSVRQDYEDKHNGNSPVVQINDVCFAVHALICTVITIAQMVIYNGKDQMPSKLSLRTVSVVLFTIIIYFVLCITINSSVFIFLNWLYYLSFVKIGITLVKYIPQALSNYERKSTLGWSINTVIMDIIGSILSILQLVLDCYDLDDWSGITGNIVKLFLGSISLIFDGIFAVQHYILYSHDNGYQYKPLQNTITSPMLDDMNETAARYSAGDKVVYTSGNGERHIATILEMHLDDKVPYYTIRLRNDEHVPPLVYEKQTDGGHLQPHNDTSVPSWVL